MKRCPSCQATYADDQTFCSNDGTQLVAEVPPPDLARTVVASSAPPPPPQNAGSDIPPTQVLGANPQYDKRAPQPPQPSTQFAPYAPQQPPFAPQYQQQQYAPQQPYGTPPKSNRKMLYIGIASVVVLAGVGLLLWFLLSGGNKSLGTYKGSLSDLLPQVNAGYSRTSEGTLDEVDKGLEREAKKFFSYDEARVGKYEHSEKKMLFAVANFSSPEKAKDALNKIKQEWRGPGVSKIDEGKTSKGGDKLVYEFQERPTEPKLTVVVWTNGSVVFAAAPSTILGRGAGESSVPSSVDILGFEQGYSH